MFNHYGSNPVVTNSIFWSASGGEISNNSGSTPALTYCVVQGGYEGTGNTDADPKLGPLADNGGPAWTHALLAGSSAQGAGTSTGAPGTDQRGISRPRGPKYDIGAYEAEAGSLTVTIEPEGARTAGAQWSVDGGTTWRNSGATASDLLPGGYTVAFKDATGWTKPDDQSVTVTKDATSQAEGIYIRHIGDLRVVIAGPAGARWSVDGTAWKASGETITALPTGVHTVFFNEVSGWTKPADQNATVNKNGLTELAVTYTASPTPTPTPRRNRRRPQPRPPRQTQHQPPHRPQHQHRRRHRRRHRRLCQRQVRPRRRRLYRRRHLCRRQVRRRHQVRHRRRRLCRRRRQLRQSSHRSCRRIRRFRKAPVLPCRRRW